MLVKKFETNCPVRLIDENGKMLYHGTYFMSEKFGEMVATDYGILVKGQVVTYGTIINFSPDLSSETIKTKKSKKQVGDMERKAFSVSEAAECN